MRLKRFIAPTMPEALKMIKHDLGPEAVILSTRKVKNAKGELTLEITAAVDSLDVPAAPAPKPTAPNVYQAPATSHNPLMSALAAHLLEHGVSTPTVERIARAVEALEQTGFNGHDGLEMVLSKMMRFERPQQTIPTGTPIMLVGPTGAGKTTTLAKIAVQQRRAGRSIGLITLDNYKIGAVEQLKIYADALKEDLLIATGDTPLDGALKQLANRDVVLIDTPGINPFERSRLDDLLQRIEGTGIKVMLVLPANLHQAEMAALPQVFSLLHPQGIIISKMDETGHLGGLVNTATESALPLCFATDGQRVPHDILELDSQSLAKRLLEAPRLPWQTLDTPKKESHQ